MAVSIGTVIALIKALGGADPSVIASAVDAWLDDHPEATTTVEDGSITYDKLASALAAVIDSIADKYEKPSGGIPGTDLASGVIPDISGKQNAPTSPGTAGQVLGLDANLDPVWTNKGGGGGGGAVDDVQVNGVSVLDALTKIANIPLADSSNPGVGKINSNYGVFLANSGTTFAVNAASTNNVKAGSETYKPVVPLHQHEATFYGIAKAAGDSTQSSSSNAVGTYTEDAKSKISDMLNAPETVSGTTPTITAKAGVRYICGECSTLSITAPASGCIDVVFESGSTPTVLTVSSAKSGVSAIKWANGFDPTALDANTTYEVNILDGEFGVVGSWT